MATDLADPLQAGQPGRVGQQAECVPDRLPDSEPEAEPEAEPDPDLTAELRET